MTCLAFIFIAASFGACAGFLTVSLLKMGADQ